MRRPSWKTLFLIVLVLALLAGLLAVYRLDGPRAAMAGVGLPFLRAQTEAQSAGERVRGLLPVRAAERARLRRLEILVRHLELQLQGFQNAATENRELRAFLELPPATGWRLVIAPVIARDPVAWNRRFRIGKGAQEGVTMGAAVLSGNAVIGRIAEVSPSSAVVLCLADPSCRLSVRVEATKAVGILAGRAVQTWHDPPRCLVDYLPRDLAYHEGEKVVTSGLGLDVPAGLSVGRIAAWKADQVTNVVSSAYAQVLLQPEGDFVHFRHVAVVCPRPLARGTPVPPPPDSDE